ncbi:lipid-A-disaccharide synthase [Rhodobacteraceae bacterium 2376]|uniref:Lipid-A-disaccharide synthase n=1 Tax=Rhabdonatronobacter sediminivivens TaxID=2743469 RepID=A0A7Z0HYA1_9RHOB|nr:lipid-A-disaccharide synthase [Rhabdonatronobacter sediminivivens]NYS24519.1 lipid-A-disaccharide synthase [Rhabdonatronobacter sediminivivens]
MKLFLIGGEPSGDRLGGALMAGLSQLSPGVAFDGIGGPEMAAQGLRSRFPMSELSVMGLWEVLPRYRALKRRIRDTAQAIARTNPDAVITIDSPDFCLRVLRLARAANPRLRTIHYVAPSVWAWRPGRAARMAPLVDHVLALLPFEPPYMQAAGMSCDFVGHPVVAEPQATRAEASAFRATHAIAPDAPLILTLPGSRRGEIARLAPRFADTLRLVLRDHPGARVVVPTVADQAQTLHEALRNWPGAPLLLTPEHGPQTKRAAFAAADAALAASGTVSLELAASVTPMVIGYDFNPLTRALVARMLQIDTVTLVNLVSETRAIPEFLGANCCPGPMAQALSTLLRAPQARAAQMQAMALTMERLGEGGDPPGLRAARSVLTHLSS